MGANWRLHLGDIGRALPMTIRQPPAAGQQVGDPYDLTGVTRVRVTITRLADWAVVQDVDASIVDAATGQVTVDTVAAVAEVPGYLQVEARVDLADGDRHHDTLRHILVVGRLAPEAVVGGGGAGTGAFVIQVAQWTPTGDAVVEVQRLDADLATVGDPTYLWDDPSDGTETMVPWPGDPTTLLDYNPTQ